MKPKHFILLVIPIVFLNCKSPNIALYVGTYTKGDSEGIYRLDFNTKTGILSNLQLSVATDNPSFLTYSPDRTYMYSTNGTGNGFLSSYKVNNDGSLTILNRVSSEGKGPCHISINNKGTKIAISNYGGGTVSIYPIHTDGSLKEASQVFNHNTNNETSHVHSAQFFKDDLFVADLGRNAIYQYVLNNDAYKLKHEAIVKTTGNPGPRHFALTKDVNYIYVINEYGASITSIKRTENGFELIDEDNTLEPTFKGFNKCADIHLSKDERFLYGSNRGENTIAVFKRDITTGNIERIQNISVHGDWPRNFTIDPTGKFLLVANRNTQNIAVFSIDNTSGKLSFLHDVKVPEPVCLLF
ncbi:lactonase family protein [Jejuia pallidilutea]|uniref:6-phosphogluconolactonase n=1 Tax=Jejuia pallidilutea TaxID=504487 RepID=A0A090VSQ5_9FLAO|nr:lactonase family protein [Jejuia pallidilutea]GAL67775.1 6-phosphogluconolactonase [Jejuia pallidilutea]GAL88280.1 6-phosphogluconolactonase [Jejuia pallidilutea]